jgi:hypothetical protein
MDKIVVNKNASVGAVSVAYLRAIEEIRKQAERGQEHFRVQFTLPNYMDGSAVQKLLEQHGIECCERGFHSEKNNDGSYDFDINFKMKEK